jgi:hypothetical protein
MDPRLGLRAALRITAPGILQKLRGFSEKCWPPFRTSRQLARARLIARVTGQPGAGSSSRPRAVGWSASTRTPGWIWGARPARQEAEPRIERGTSPPAVVAPPHRHRSRTTATSSPVRPATRTRLGDRRPECGTPPPPRQPVSSPRSRPLNHERHARRTLRQPRPAAHRAPQIPLAPSIAISEPAFDLYAAPPHRRRPVSQAIAEPMRNGGTCRLTPVSPRWAGLGDTSQSTVFAAAA